MKPVPAPLTASRLAVALVGALVLALACAAVAACMGPAGFAPQDLWRALGSGPEAEILREARWTRVALGLVCGAALSIAGAALQALLKNPLADPYVVGVSGGAAVGGTLALTLSEVAGVGASLGGWLLPVGAYGGALLVLVVVWAAARASGGVSAVGVLLSGVVFNAFCLALVSVLRLMVRAETAQALMAWMMGSIGSETWTTVLMSAAYVGVGVAWLVALAGRLHLLAQGDEAAARLGVEVHATRRAAYLATSLVVAGVVGTTGMIGFVGLLVPHACRLVLGADVRLVLPFSALAGAGMLVLCDGAARALFGMLGTELPVGAITSLVGAPWFLWLLRRHLGGGGRA